MAAYSNKVKTLSLATGYKVLVGTTGKWRKAAIPNLSAINVLFPAKLSRQS